MSVTYGFYNSINGDRKYNALEMSSIFDGIIVDGVYMSIGDALNVQSSGGMGITVGIGRAWFDHTWTLNDSLLPLTLESSDVLLNRIDAVVLEINNNTEVRRNEIKIVKGAPASNPVRPTLVKNELLNQHPLAYISVPKGATSISQSNITNAVGTSECPFVTGVLEGMNIDNLVAQWGAQWAEWISSNTSEFESWFQEMKDQLSTDAAGNLQASKMDKATYDADGDGVVDEAEKVSNALTLKNAAGEVVATFDGSEAAILQLTAALVGALGKTEKAADSSKLAGLTPVIDNPGPNNRNTWYFPFTGTNNRDGTRKYYAALYADNATTAGRASNLSMGLNGTDLWVYYS